MKRLLIGPLLAVTAGCAATGPVEPSAEEQSDLTQALRGRIAGEPMACVQQRNLRNNRSYGETAILFEGPGDVIYMNRPRAGCPEITQSRALVTRTTSGQLCRGDIVSVVDPVQNFNYGSCGLGDFVPYRRAD